MAGPKRAALDRTKAFRTGTKVDDARIVPCVYVTCDKCDHEEALLNVAKFTSPDAVARLARKKGWEADSEGRSARCPSCQNTKPKGEKESMSNTTDNARLAKRKVLDLLDLHFNADAGRYGDGWDDEKVAGESDMAVAAVAKIREEFFGPIKEDPEVSRLQSEIAQLGAFVAKEAQELRAMIEAMEQDARNRLQSALARLEELTKRRK